MTIQQEFIGSLPITDKHSDAYLHYRKESTPFSSIVRAIDDLENNQGNYGIVSFDFDQNDIPLQQIKQKLALWLEILSNKAADNTIAALNYDLTIYIASCAKHSVNPFTITPREFIKITEERRANSQPATMSRYCNSISKFYSALELDNPMANELVKSIFIKHRKQKGAGQKQAEPLHFEHLDKLYETLDLTITKNVRDLIVLSFMLECLMRRAEIVMIKIEDISIENGIPLLTIPKSKTDQDGSDCATIPFSMRTLNLIETWLNMTNIKSGYLIRGLTKTHTIRTTAVNVSLINKISARASAILNLETRLSGHSGRVGGIQELVNAGYSNTAIQLNARLKTPHMVSRYARKISASNLPMAEYFSNRESK